MRKLLLLLLLLFALSVPLVVSAQQKQSLTASSTDCSVANSCLTVKIDRNQGGATFTITSNASSNTIQFEATGDGGASWVSLTVFPSNGTAGVTSSITVGTWQTNISGYTGVRMRCSTFVSGSTTVSINQSSSAARAGGLGSGPSTVTTNSTGQTLRRLAASAQAANPLILPPLGPAPTWVASTAYVSGQVVTNGLYQYICNVAGTSASSGGPTGTSANLITDNTVSWYYYGLAAPGSASVNAPTITQSASLPGGLSNAYAYNASPSPFYYTGGFLAVSGSSQYVNHCATSFGSTLLLCTWRVTFVTDAAKIAAKTTNTQTAIRYIVDGQYVTASGYLNGSGANPSYNVIDFTNSGTRKVHTITLELDRNVQFGGVTVGPTEEVWAPKTQDRQRMIVIGDSIFSGGSNSPSVAGADTAYQLGLLLGISDVWDSSNGGIGWTATNSGTGLTFGQQAAITLPGNNPNIILFAGSVNDVGTASATEQANVVSALQTARALYPAVPIIVLGIWPDATGPSVGLKSTEADVQAGVATFNDANTYFIPIATDPVQAWMTGTGRVSSTTGTGNSDMYTAADAVHPTDMGRIYEVQRDALAIRNVIQQIP